ncbi:MAG: hypothetical protein R3E64_02555 [Halioglobus sp.]
MSLLNDLQEEVKKIRAREMAQDAKREAQAKYYQQQLRPVMQRAYAYFAEIVDNLNIIAPEIKVRYPLNPQLENGISLKQSQYKFRSDNRDNPQQIDIFCRCTLEKPHEFYLSSPKAIQQHVELLNSYNFAYHRKNRLNRHHEIRGATFILEGPMMVHIRIAANAADSSVHVGFRCLEQQPVKRYRFAPEDVTDELLERIAKVLMRQLTTLVDKKKVDPRLRHQLRSQIEQERFETEQDIAQAYADRQAAIQEQRTASMIHRTRHTVKEGARKLIGAIAKR